jgi:hypothetical protein
MENLLGGGVCHTRTVILDRNLASRAVPNGGGPNCRTRMAAGIVEKVAKHFIEILYFNRDFDASCRCCGKVEMSFAIKALHRPQDFREAVGGIAMNSRNPGGGGAGAGQGVIDLPLDGHGLHAHCLRSLAGAQSISRIGKYGQRRFQSVREVAGLRPATLDGLAAMRQERV